MKLILRSKMKKKNNIKEKKTSIASDNEVYVKPKRKRSFRFWYWLFVVIVACGLFVFLGGIGFCYYIVRTMFYGGKFWIELL